MPINKIIVLFKLVQIADKYSLPFKDKLFEALTIARYDGIFHENPDRLGNKHSKILDYVIDQIAQESKILDLGCGNGKDSLWLAGQGMVVDAVDFSEQSIKIISERIDEDIQHNIVPHQSSIKEYLRSNTKQYNLISCQNALQFDADWYSRIKEMQDCTLPGGYNISLDH